MVGSCTSMGSEMGSEEQSKRKDADDLIAFMRKRSETDAPRYTARLKTYVDIKQKRRRAAAARRHAANRHNQDSSAPRKENNAEQRDKSADKLQHATEEDRVNKRRGEKCIHKPRSLSGSRSGEPSDACGRRRRRRRRARSCRRRSRRRRRRRSCGRRRRRSCSRRRRRRSCRRRRRRRRRCR